jgi:thioredoxin 1
MILEMTDETFAQHIAQDICLVLFYKDPCPYCQTMKGVVEKFGSRNPAVKLLQINGLENTKSAGMLEVERFPDIIFYKNGSPTQARQKGLTNPQGLAALLQTINT